MSNQRLAAAADVSVAVPVPTAPSALRRSLRYGRTQMGLALIALILLAALAGPYLSPHTPSELIGAPFAGPSSEAPLGLDYLGHDVLSRVLWGGRSVVWMSFAATTVGVGLGVVVGMLAGYTGGRLDDAIMRTLDVVLAFPQLVLVLVFVSVLGTKLWLIALLVAVAWIPGVARVARGITLEAASKEFVEAAEVLGVPRRRILTREILPNLISPLMVEYGLRLTWSIAVIAAIGFLGFGVQPPQADWGLMINENRNGLTIQAWAVVVPTACIALFTVGTNLVAEGIGRAVAGIDRQVGPR
jgi:peptide/nickel transport system permease protein